MWRTVERGVMIVEISNGFALYHIARLMLTKALRLQELAGSCVKKDARIVHVSSVLMDKTIVFDG